MYESTGGRVPLYGFDRHWRNARTLSLHNPLDFKLMHAGDYLLRGCDVRGLDPVQGVRRRKRPVPGLGVVEPIRCATEVSPRVIHRVI